MRILYFSIDYLYLNPTRRSFEALLSSLGVHIYFVGSSLFSTIELRSLSTFLDSYDLVISTRDFFPYQGISLHLSKLSRYTRSISISPHDIEIWRSVLSYLSVNRHKSIMFLVDNDCLGNTYKQLDHYLFYSKFFITPSQDMCPTIVPSFLEPYTEFKESSYHVYNDFRITYKSHIFDCSHILNDSEFVSADIKSSLLSVPGASYTRRSLLSSYLSLFPKHKFHYCHLSNLFNKFFAVFALFYPDLYSISSIVNIRRFFYSKLLSSSSICLTDGGYHDFSVRKLFEIPASSSVLASWPTSYVYATGLSHNIDYIDCSQFTSFSYFLDYIYSLAPSVLHSLSHNGKIKVFNLHSSSSKLQPISYFFTSLINSSFFGSVITPNGNVFLDS